MDAGIIINMTNDANKLTHRDIREFVTYAIAKA
jgi:hypothetical protein